MLTLESQTSMVGVLVILLMMSIHTVDTISYHPNPYHPYQPVAGRIQHTLLSSEALFIVGVCSGIVKLSHLLT
jgi:hypothetical protein